MRTLPILLLLTAIAMAAPPDWVKAGQAVQYDLRQYATGIPSGSPTVQLEFTVTGRSGDTIAMDLKQLESGTTRTSHPTDNTTKVSGQFWFDPTLLSTAQYVAQYIYDWQVESLGKKTVAGQEWDTVTLKKVIEGADVHNTYDKKTGLLLVNVVVVGRQTYEVNFKSMTPPLPGLPAPASAPAPQPAPSPQSAPAPAPAPAPVPTTTQNVNTTVPANGTAPVVIPVFQEPEPAKKEPASKTNIPFCPGIFVFGLMGAGMVWARRRAKFG